MRGAVSGTDFAYGCDRWPEVLRQHLQVFVEAMLPFTEATLQFWMARLPFMEALLPCVKTVMLPNMAAKLTSMAAGRARGDAGGDLEAVLSYTLAMLGPKACCCHVTACTTEAGYVATRLLAMRSPILKLWGTVDQAGEA
eukprot:3646534-Rhodomonas_salina.5